MNKSQIIKLFSNPVSGIACEIKPKLIPFENEHSFGVKEEEEQNFDFLKDIRYSKSMMLGALDFWFDQYHAYWKKLWFMRTKFIDMSQNVIDLLQELGSRMEIVRNCPDSFLFSHRYIKEVNINSYRGIGGKNLVMTNSLLNKKYENLIVNNGFRPQVGTLDPFMPVMSSTGIHFSIFANEHPYIAKQKISKVGMTDKGNVYVLHKKDSNGAYTPTTTTKENKTVQAPNKTFIDDHIPKLKWTILRELIDVQSELRIDD